MATRAINPAKNLAACLIPNGWHVVGPVPKSPAATGGFFSEGYIVENIEGKKAYLKAIDYSEAAASPDPALAIKSITDAYVFERALLTKCRSKKLDRIVSAIDAGSLGSSPSDLVLYLIFELADGDLRQHLASALRIDLAWKLRVLHQIVVGLRQLHNQEIAHQDIKPSNVLLFSQLGTKLADLGRAAAIGMKPPHDDLEIAGDRTYAPPELLYHHLPADWRARRYGCDAYLLGSMVVYFLTGSGMTHVLIGELAGSQRPSIWNGTYLDLLPAIRDAFARVLVDLRNSIPRGAEDLVTVVKELCDPDPTLRGHPKNSPGNQFSLERYVTRFDLLARKAELGVIS